jgi:predicted aspartyl protease
VKVSFDSKAGSISVLARKMGLRGNDVFTLILDTGAESTVLNPEVLRDLGLTPLKTAKKLRLITASGVAIGAKVIIPKFTALGKTKLNFEIATLALPKDVEADGVLGLDFFRGYELNINFKTGHIELK